MTYLSQNCLVMKRAPLPVRKRDAKVVLNKLMAAPFSLMKLATCRLSYKRVCCVFCQTVFSIASVVTLNVSASSRKRKFSVGTKPARKMLIPSRTEKGIVTTPYAPGLP